MVELRPLGADWTNEQKLIMKYFNETLPRLVTAGAKEKGCYTKAKELAGHAGMSTKGTCEALRKQVFLLNIGHKVPVISTNKGYKIADNSHEVRRYALDLKGRAEKELLRANVLLELAEKMQ